MPFSYTANRCELKPMKRERLDKRVLEAGLAETRTRAQALILAGQILVDDKMVDKAGALIELDAELRLRGEPLPYVSRGGLKLKKALDHFALVVRGQSALDVGASTGGFTDCLLQSGCARVCAVDVGYGQLAWKLQQDARVVSIERQNIRHLDVATLPFVPEWVVCDVSFISLTLVLPKLVEAIKPGGVIVALCKPQFEVGKGQVGKGGVVREDAARQACVQKCEAAAIALGCAVVGAVESPIRGPAGNVEYLLCLKTAC